MSSSGCSELFLYYQIYMLILLDFKQHNSSKILEQDTLVLVISKWSLVSKKYNSEKNRKGNQKDNLMPEISKKIENGN